MLGTNDYPNGNGGCPVTHDQWGCQLRQCTSFAAWRMFHDGGLAGFRCWGDAGQWPGQARSHGLAVDSNPETPGGFTLFVLPPGVNGALGAGHIGVVLSFTGTTVWVEDYNWGETCSYHQHSLPRSGTVFIHVPGSGVVTPPTPPQCPNGGTWDGTVCQGAPVCPPGFTLSEGSCVPPQGPGVVVCPDGSLPAADGSCPAGPPSAAGGGGVGWLVLAGVAGGGAWWLARTHRLGMLHLGEGGGDGGFGSSAPTASARPPRSRSHTESPRVTTSAPPGPQPSAFGA